MENDEPKRLERLEHENKVYNTRRKNRGHNLSV